MRVSVRCGAARPVQLRGAARAVPTPARAAPASRCLQRFGRRARLGQGCAPRLIAAAAAAVGEPEPPRSAVGGEAAQAKPQKRRQKARHAGERSEKTADGKPKPDERTVADLVERGWFESEEDAVALLTRAPSRINRFAFETAKPAADWLEAKLGLVPLKGGVLPAAKAVKAFPDLLCQDAATLQRKWEALMLPAEQGGVGIALSKEQAREAVLRFPQILGITTDKLKRGWSMLTATEGGLGLSPEEARSCILRSPNVVLCDHDAVVRRVELLKSLGYPKGHEMALTNSGVLLYTNETVREHAAWWKQTGLDHVKLVEQHPLLLGANSTAELDAKLSFLRDVAWLSTDDLNNAAPMLSYSMDEMLRPRFFYACKHEALERNKLSTLTFCSSAVYLRKVHQLDAPASEDEVDLYKETVASADFLAWAAQEEARRRGAPAAAKVSHG